MPGRDFDDDAELRPLDEATHAPDELDTISGDRYGESTHRGYPDDTESTPECCSCGASIPLVDEVPHTVVMIVFVPFTVSLAGVL